MATMMVDAPPRHAGDALKPAVAEDSADLFVRFKRTQRLLEMLDIQVRRGARVTAARAQANLSPRAHTGE